MTSLPEALRACVEQMEFETVAHQARTYSPVINRDFLLARLEAFARQFVADEDAVVEALERRVDTDATRIAALTAERDALKVRVLELDAMRCTHYAGSSFSFDDEHKRRLVAEAQLAAAEAERDALKAERDELRRQSFDVELAVRDSLRHLAAAEAKLEHRAASYDQLAEKLADYRAEITAAEAARAALRDALEALVKAIPPIEHSARWGHQNSARASAHQEFIREDADNMAAFVKARTVAEALLAPPAGERPNG